MSQPATYYWGIVQLVKTEAFEAFNPGPSPGTPTMIPFDDKDKWVLKLLLEALKDNRYIGQKLQPKQALYLLELLNKDIKQP